MKEMAAEAASPASFQPLKAHTITGVRSAGRLLQITSDISFHGTRRVRANAQNELVTVAELRPGGEVQGVFACTRKDRLLEVAGRAERSRDELQIELSSIRRADPGTADPAEFLPVAYRDLDELDGFLEHLAREVYDRHYRALLTAFLDDAEFRAALRRSPCTRAGHHAYLGGLLEHTVAVATLAQETSALHVRLDSDLLLTAAILHDAGKVREFELGAEIALSEEGALLGHLAIGQRLLVERATRIDGFPADKLLAVTHCLLAHHGADSLPSRRFRTPEALALYRLNRVDAAVKGALEHSLAA